MRRRLQDAVEREMAFRGGVYTQTDAVYNDTDHLSRTRNWSDPLLSRLGITLDDDLPNMLV